MSPPFKWRSRYAYDASGGLTAEYREVWRAGHGVNAELFEYAPDDQAPGDGAAPALTPLACAGDEARIAAHQSARGLRPALRAAVAVRRDAATLYAMVAFDEDGYRVVEWTDALETPGWQLVTKRQYAGGQLVRESLWHWRLGRTLTAYQYASVPALTPDGATD